MIQGSQKHIRKLLHSRLSTVVAIIIEKGGDTQDRIIDSSQKGESREFFGESCHS